MKRLFLLISTFFITNLLSAEQLKFEKIIFNRDNSEISGLFLKDGQLLFVADKLSNRAIYKVRYENDRFFYKNYIDISKLNGHSSYFAKALLFKHGGRIVKSPFDLEGLTACGDTFYLANEQARHILKIDRKSITNLGIDFNAAFKKFGTPLNKVSTNAGFEGLTVDCKNKILYIAQERQPRAIIVVDLNTNKTVDMFQTPSVKKGKISPDYTDMYFENDFLYVLERNAHQILKIDPKTKKVIATKKFGHTDSLHLRDIYDTGEPYGLGEGLAMSDKQIFIGVDNNKNPISKKAEEAFKVKGKFSAIMIYTRPKGF